MLRPIAGAPPGAPNPEFPTEPEDEPRSEQFNPLDMKSDPEQVMDDNELGDRGTRYASVGNTAGRSRWSSGSRRPSCSKPNTTPTASSGGERYEKFAFMHGRATNSTDANNMYVLGEDGDAYFQRYEDEAQVTPTFDWPGWRAVVTQIKREQKRRGAAESEEVAEGSDDADDDADDDAG